MDLEKLNVRFSVHVHLIYKLHSFDFSFKFHRANASSRDANGTSGETAFSSAAGWFGFSTSQMKLMRGRESSMRWNRKIEYDATKRCGPWPLLANFRAGKR